MRFLKWLIRLVPGFIVMGLTLWAILFFVFAPKLPDTSTLWEESASPAITLLDEQDRVIGTRGGAGLRPIRLSELPNYLGQAVIAIEDKRFYDHFGLDVIGFARAIITNIKAGAIRQGGSTITQQLAKNLFLSHERSLKRKLEELFLAIWLETRLSKDEILALYLNRVYFGAGAYGVETAARRYFNKSAKSLTLAESAMLAGLLKAPSVLAPTNNLNRAQARARVVLTTMVQAGFIEVRQADEAKANPAKVAPRIAQETGYFIDLALSRVEDRLGRPQRDMAVGTTLNLTVQRATERAVNAVFERELVKESPLETAVVILDQAGGIKAMLGGRFYGRSSFNRAIQANRQVGSAFKPVVVAAGLKEGIQPATRVDDGPITVDGWSPRNADGQYQGRVTVETALAKSLNVATVRLSETIGRERVIEMAGALGIDANIQPVPALALGTAQVSALDMARAYGAFAFDGVLPAPHLLRAVRAGRDESLWFEPPQGAAVMNAAHARQMTQMLQTAVRDGTGRAAAASGCNPAGKTGTTQRARDAWFIGYCRGLVAAVWVGFDDNRPMRGVTGGGLPAKIFAEIFQALPNYQPAPTPAAKPDQLAEALANEGVDWLLQQLQTVLDELTRP